MVLMIFHSYVSDALFLNILAVHKEIIYPPGLYSFEVNFVQHAFYLNVLAVEYICADLRFYILLK